MKKPLFFLYAVLLFICFVLTMRYFMNEVSVNNYLNGKYDNDINNFLLLVNFPQPYVAHYNKGNNLYYTYDYEGAVKEYDEALKTTPKRLRCAVFNNQALALSKQLDPNSEFYTSEIEYIQKILEREGCAQQDGSGSDDKSQEMYDQLEDEKKKKEQQDQGGQGEEEEPFNPEEYDGLEDELDKQQEETSKEREKGQQGKYNPYNPKW